MPDQQTEYTYLIQGREVDREDIDQEAAIFEWETGKRANRALIAKHLANQDPAATFSGDPTTVAWALPTGLNLPNPRVIQKLVDWSLEQSDRIRSVMLDFLDEPSEESLVSTLAILMDEGIIQSAIPPKAEKASFADAIVRLLTTDRRIYSSQELYAWARGIHSAKRPEATVRQALRRLISLGKVTKLGDSQYQITEEV